MHINEIQIPVPWGYIAAKTWGNSTDPLVLTIHGWVDNANSFDTLIPLLPPCFFFVCIDLPGHGRSSPVETSLILRDVDYVIALKFIYNYFKRDKIAIIAHSFGGFLTLNFTQLYSKCVSKIVILDAFYNYPKPPNVQFAKMFNHYNQRIKFLSRKNKESPAYTKEEIIDKILTNRISQLSRRAAEILIERNIQSIGNGKYKFSVADNVKHIVFSSMPIDGIVDVMQKFPIQCPHMLLLSSNSSFLRFAFKKVHNLYQKNPNYEFHLVEGTHEVHLENPERVAPLISQFLLKHQNKL